MNLNPVTLPALDVRTSVAFCLVRGFETIVDAPHMPASSRHHRVADSAAVFGCFTTRL